MLLSDAELMLLTRAVTFTLYHVQRDPQHTFNTVYALEQMLDRLTSEPPGHKAHERGQDEEADDQPDDQ